MPVPLSCLPLLTVPVCVLLEICLGSSSLMILPKQGEMQGSLTWLTYPHPSSHFSNTACWQDYWTCTWEQGACCPFGSLWSQGKLCSITRSPQSPQALCATRKAHLGQNTGLYLSCVSRSWSSIKEEENYHTTSAAKASTPMLCSSLSSFVSVL